ncbi:MAG: DNA-binding protein [Clostridia bacterium]|nr:DNA-binding protein [Clostridia bacterium]
MFEKDMRLVLLLDMYGDLLGEHRRELIEMYYCEDLSLAEIAENSGISRQGVRESIKKSETELRMFEEKLHLVEKFERIRSQCAEKAHTLENALPLLTDASARKALTEAAAYLRAIPL